MNIPLFTCGGDGGAADVTLSPKAQQPGQGSCSCGAVGLARMPLTRGTPGLGGGEARTQGSRKPLGMGRGGTAAKGPGCPDLNP